MKYKTIVCGGTFDLLHKGHKSLLQQIFYLGEEVIIGITSDAYVNNFKTEVFEDFKTRKENLQKFLDQKGLLERSKIVAIDDLYGPLLDKDLVADLIAVTKDTKNGAIKINNKRVDLGLHPLEIKELEMDQAEDGQEISSTRIRNGEINRDGKLYIKPEWKGKSFSLPEELRGELHKPFGEFIDTTPAYINSEQIITIGDITTQKFVAEKIVPFISIVDFVVERQKKFDSVFELGFSSEAEIITVDNLAGQISSNLFNSIINSFKNNEKKIILVNGEEDLAVLPVLLSAPLSFIIFYGQPGEGLVEVDITEETKERGYQLLSKFRIE